MNKPLAGVRIVEIGQLSAVPYCGRLLAMLGADVIKVESPPLRGDLSRLLGPFLGRRFDLNSSAIFHYFNAGKRSVSLDYARFTGNHILHAILRTSDVLVHDLRPAEATKLGLSLDNLRLSNPLFVSTSITGFGSVGPNANMASSGFTSYQFGGLGTISPMYGASEADQPLHAGGRQAELQSGLYGAIGILAEIFRQKSGSTLLGQEIDISSVEAIIMCQESAIPMYTYQGVSPTRVGKMMNSAPVGLYPAKDGQFFIFCLTDDWWDGLVRMMNAPEWCNHKEFATGQSRAQVSEAIDVLVSEWTREFMVSELYDMSQKHHLPFSPVNTAKDLLASEQLDSRQFWTRVGGTDETAEAMMPGAPFVMSGTELSVSSRAPDLGEHTAQVLTELGYSTAEILGFRSAGLI